MSATDAMRCVVALLALLLGAACSPVTVVSSLAVRTGADDSAPATEASARARFERLVAVATERGYTVAPLQPSRLRFGVSTRYSDSAAESRQPYRLAVECERGVTICRLTPLGPRVERSSEGYVVPVELGEEIVELRTAMQRSMSPSER